MDCDESCFLLCRYWIWDYIAYISICISTQDMGFGDTGYRWTRKDLLKVDIIAADAAFLGYPRWLIGTSSTIAFTVQVSRLITVLIQFAQPKQPLVFKSI